MREAGALAKRLVASECEKQGIEEGQLGLHADRGPSMKSKPVEFLLVDLGVDETPQVPARVPGALRPHPGGALFLPGFLHLAQRAPPALGDRLPRPGDGPLRTCRGRDRCRAGRAPGGIRLSPGALCESCSKTAGTAGSEVMLHWIQKVGVSRSLTRSAARSRATSSPRLNAAHASCSWTARPTGSRSTPSHLVQRGGSGSSHAPSH